MSLCNIQLLRNCPEKGENTEAEVFKQSSMKDQLSALLALCEVHLLGFVFKG